MGTREYNESRLRLHKLRGSMAYHLEIFGDELAKREGYKVHEGLDAVRFFLVEKYGWLPRDVRAMSPEDLRWVMDEEMHGWTVPKEAQFTDEPDR